MTRGRVEGTVRASDEAEEGLRSSARPSLSDNSGWSRRVRCNRRTEATPKVAGGGGAGEEAAVLRGRTQREEETRRNLKAAEEEEEELGREDESVVAPATR